MKKKAQEVVNMYFRVLNLHKTDWNSKPDDEYTLHNKANIRLMYAARFDTIQDLGLMSNEECVECKNKMHEIIYGEDREG